MQNTTQRRMVNAAQLLLIAALVGLNTVAGELDISLL